MQQSGDPRSIRAVLIGLALPFIFLFPRSGTAQGKMIYKGDTVNVLDDKGRKHGKWVRTFQGSRTIRLIGRFEHGTPQDSFEYYYPDGSLKAINVFGDKGMVSEATTYHPNGSKMAEGTYVNKKKSGKWTFYDAEGVKSAVQEYKQGDPHGIGLVFYRNGDTASIKHYRDSLPHGPWQQFFKGGVTKAKGRYQEGTRVGPLKRYHPNGQLKYKGQHHRSKGYRVGEWVWYDEEGKLERKVIYDAGKIDSIIGPDGELISKGPLLDTTGAERPPGKVERDAPRLNREPDRWEKQRRSREKRRRGP
jgi:antitoxin component YwqK of YwqJK toxin-antitoxin module